MDLERLKSLWPELEPVLDELLELDDPAREAELARRYATEPEKRALMESLLRADRDSGDLLERPAVPRRSVPTAAPVTPGMRIGAWAVRRELGRGGMGTVVLAERDDGQFEQCVAIKLVRPDAWHPAAHERFLLERSILARLQHPNIARLIDGGVREDGSPYLVMEFVEGVPITAWCDARRLDVRARLRLFRQVCDAVEYAHGMLVVHRDLKPANILVTERGEVKLLDFGIAKLLDSPAATEATHASARALTPAYAAPEQFLGEPMTSATDQYQLALVLYELLTGVRAHGDTTHSPLVHQRAVLDSDPRAPSRAVAREPAGGEPGASPPAPESAALARGATPAALARALAGDLDSIVLKALDRDPGQRYSSVEAFRRDLESVLDERPVSARHATVGYRLRKYVRRNRLAVGAAALVLLALLAGFAGVLVQARIAAHERDLARAAEQKATAINDFILRELLESPGPERSLGRALTVSEVLASASRTVGLSFPNDPRTEAAVRLTLARSYQALGRLDSAGVHAEAAQRLLASGPGADARASLEARALLADLALDRGRFDEARREFEATAAEQARRLGPRATETLRSRAGLARALAADGRFADADSILRAVLALAPAEDGRDWRLVVEIQSSLADVWSRQSRARAADSLLRDMLDAELRHVGPGHPLVVATELKRGRALRADLRFTEAARVLGDAVRGSARLNGEEHPATADAMLGLAEALDSAARHEESVRWLERAVAIYRRSLGPAHPRTLMALRDLAVMLRSAGHFARADSAYREAYRVCATTLGPAHPQTIQALRGIVYLRLDEGRDAEARAIARQIRALYLRVAAAPDADPSALTEAALYLTEAEPPDVRDPRRAVAFASRAVERTRRTDYTALRALGFAAVAAGDTNLAVASLRDALALPDGVRSWTTEEMLVRLLSARHATRELEPLLLARVARVRALRGEHDRYAAKTLRHLSRLCLAQGRHGEAERWARETIAQLRRTLPADHWEVGRAESELGGLLAERGRSVEAESLLVRGYRSLDADAEVENELVDSARERLVSAYTAWGRGDSADAWRSRTRTRGPNPRR